MPNKIYRIIGTSKPNEFVTVCVEVAPRQTLKNFSKLEQHERRWQMFREKTSFFQYETIQMEISMCVMN